MLPADLQQFFHWCSALLWVQSRSLVFWLHRSLVSVKNIVDCSRCRLDTQCSWFLQYYTWKCHVNIFFFLWLILMWKKCNLYSSTKIQILKSKLDKNTEISVKCSSSITSYPVQDHARGGGAYPIWHWARGGTTPWTSHQLIAGLRPTIRHTHTYRTLRVESPGHPTSKSLDCGMNQQNLEGAHADTKRTCRLHRDGPQPGNRTQDLHQHV